MTKSRPTNLPTLVFVLFLAGILGLAPSEVAAQTPLELVVEDSRGNPVDGSLTIGRSLWVGLTGAVPFETYRFRLLDDDGDLVAETVGMSDFEGGLALDKLWGKTGVEGCGGVGTGGGNLQGKSDVDGPFANLAEASAVLDGLAFTLTVQQGGGSPLLSELIVLTDPDEAVYYWSDATGDERCVFDSGDPIYLSVYKGTLEDFSTSRIFLLYEPSSPMSPAWSVGMTFSEARLRPGCVVSQVDDCGYNDGSDELLPYTATVPLVGVLPQGGRFVAIIRGAADLHGEQRYLCDRVTESAMSIGWPQGSANQDGWGCPPCPPA